MDSHIKVIFCISSVVLLLAIADASCICSASGDPHFVMCSYLIFAFSYIYVLIVNCTGDKKARFDWQGTGLHQLFSTKDGDMSVELQCELSQRKGHGSFSYVDSCRVMVQKGPCNVNFRTGGIDNPNEISVYGKTMPTESLSTFVNEIPKDIGVRLRAKGDTVLCEIELPTAGDVKFVIKPYKVVVTAPDVQKCDGMCGQCSGTETVPQDIAAFARKCSQGIQPIDASPKCQASPGMPAPTTYATTKGYGVPPCVEPDDSHVVENPVFESEAVMKAVIQKCMCNQPRERLDNDPLFGSFVENCIYGNHVTGPFSF